MPFGEVSIMDGRREFVGFASQQDANMRELCRRFGVSPTTGYKWLGRYRAEGWQGLVERSRRPHGSPDRTPAELEAQVLEVRASSNNVWGGRKIKRVLENQGGTPPAASTITEILRRHGKLEPRAHEHPGPWQRFERAEPNELWQLDFKGHFAIGTGRCHPLTALDDHSRYNLVIEACGHERVETVRPALERAFRRYGLPFAILTDNGSPWADTGGDPFTRFSVWLLRLGIQVLHGRPWHPQTQGKEERFHRTLKAEVVAGRSFRDLGDCQRAFDAWRQRYNHERPHEAIGMVVPAERYRPSPRAFPQTVPPIEYAAGDAVRKVDSDGFISFRNRPRRIGKGFCGEYVAVRATAFDGLFSVHYCSHQIGQLDLRQTGVDACGLVDNAARCPQGSQANNSSSQRMQN